MVLLRSGTRTVIGKSATARLPIRHGEAGRAVKVSATKLATPCLLKDFDPATAGLGDYHHFLYAVIWADSNYVQYKNRLGILLEDDSVVQDLLCPNCRTFVESKGVTLCSMTRLVEKERVKKTAELEAATPEEAEEVAEKLKKMEVTEMVMVSCGNPACNTAFWSYSLCVPASEAVFLFDTQYDIFATNFWDRHKDMKSKSESESRNPTSPRSSCLIRDYYMPPGAGW